MSLKKLYQEMILAHNKSPRNFQELMDPSHVAHGKNPLCGDDYYIYLKVDQNDVIQDIGFQGVGCAISKASASLMTDMVKSLNKQEAVQLKDAFIRVVTADRVSQSDHDRCGPRLGIFEGVKAYPVRVKCATLIWRALESALESATEQVVSTE